MPKIVELSNESYKKYDREKYELEIEPYLTDKIFDIHAHVGTSSVVSNNITEDRKKERFELTTCTSLTYEDYFRAFNILFGSKKFSGGLFFAYPFKEINLEKANEYVGSRIDNSKIFGLITASPYHKKDYFEELIEKYAFIGFKPYPDLYDFKDESKINILDYVSEDMLYVANKYKLILLVHLKAKNNAQGINSDEYLQEIHNIFEKFPDIKLIIPHMGRAHCPKIAEAGIKKVIKYFGKDKIYFDTSTCTQRESFEIFFENYSVDKILFGNDLGVSLIRAKFYCIDDEKRVLVPREKFPWYKASGFNRNVSIFPYESLSEAFKALRNLGADKSIFNKIMYDNSNNLIKEVVKGESFGN